MVPYPGLQFLGGLDFVISPIQNCCVIQKGVFPLLNPLGCYVGWLVIVVVLVQMWVCMCVYRMSSQPRVVAEWAFLFRQRTKLCTLEPDIKQPLFTKSFGSYYRHHLAKPSPPKTNWFYPHQLPLTLREWDLFQEDFWGSLGKPEFFVVAPNQSQGYPSTT